MTGIFLIYITFLQSETEKRRERKREWKRGSKSDHSEFCVAEVFHRWLRSPNPHPTVLVLHIA